MEKICKNCKYFIKGTVVDTDLLSGINPRYTDVDRCKKTYYKITPQTMCIINKFKPKK